MKKTVIAFVAGICVATLFNSSVSTFADDIVKNIEVSVNAINLKVNGNKVNTDNFVYNGVTYVPLRAVSEMLNKDIDWDEGTQTASINNKKSTLTNGYYTDIATYDFNGIKYVAFRDVQTKLGCWFGVKGVTTLELYKNSNYLINRSKPIMSIEATTVSGKNGAATLGIEYTYYLNTLVPLLEKKSYDTKDPSDIRILKIDDKEYVSVFEIMSKHKVNNQFNCTPSEVTFAGENGSYIGKIPFIKLDTDYYIEYKTYQEKIFPLVTK